MLARTDMRDKHVSNIDLRVLTGSLEDVTRNIKWELSGPFSRHIWSTWRLLQIKQKINSVKQNTHCQKTCSLPKHNVVKPHDKTNKMSVRPAKTQISLGIRPVWSESSLCAQWVAKNPVFLHADSEDSYQTGRMPRLIWVFAGRTATFLVLTCRGSHSVCSRVDLLRTWRSTEEDRLLGL